MKKNILLMIQYIVLLVIAAGLFFLVFYKDDLKEGYQTAEALIKSKFFNTTSSYNSLNKEESPEDVQVDPDTLILDIGGAFGEVDASKMPWDSENRQLLQSEALWGIVPNDATISLFKKLYLANQLQDIYSLPIIENQFHYEDPTFLYGTDDQQLASGLQIASGLTQFIAPLAFGYFVGNKIEEDLSAIFKAKVKKPAAAKLKGVGTSIMKKADLLRFGKARLNNVLSSVPPDLAKKGGKKAAAEVVTMIENPMYKFGKGPMKWSQKFAKAGLFKKAIMVIKGIFIKLLGKLLSKALVVLVAATSWLDIAFPGLGVFFNVVVTPLILVLSLPNGPITKALDKWADSEGPCPRDSIALDQLIPQGAMMIISFIPIIGDILDLVYPYVCSVNGTGLLITKGPLKMPKYIESPWLSTYYWNWPEYNGRAERPKVQGKYLTTELDSSIQFMRGGENDLYTVSYNWDYGPYTNFDEITRDGATSKFDQVNKKLVAMKTEYVTQKFFPTDLLPSGAKFFYADFSDPTMLAQMGQFYYDFSMRKPQFNEDETVTVDIISKINYVIASSLYTCDVECEILHVTYDPSNGKKYDEYITLGHDRRFYFGVNYSANPLPYWENRTNIEWVTLDNRYDSAMYNLKEYLNRYDIFKPSEDVDGELFVTAYEEILNAQTILSNVISTSNYTTEDYNIFNSNLVGSQNNYNNLINFILKPYASSYDSNYRSRLDFRVSTVVGIKDELWDLQKRLRPVASSNKSSQYTLYGCTHLDDTASAAFPADVTGLQVDSRKKVDFNVLPYIKRCEDIFINTQVCNDISNVEQVIDMYKKSYPNKDIKSILNIKAQGKNVCQFTWNEVTTGQNNETQKTYDILYQTDLSSCTFCLPNTLVAQGSSELPVLASILMYKNPIDDPISQLYNTDYNTRLGYKKAYYYKPVITGSGPTSNITLQKIENVDTIPRYDPNTFAELPQLARPKKPIRATYPKPPETHLWKGSNDKCSNPDTLNKFILDYNSQNTSNKILSIIRAYTSSSNSCDLEVDVLNKISQTNNTVERKTLSFNVKASANEGFENIYTYDSLKNIDGINITKNTSNLQPPPYDTKGVTYGKPFVNKFNTTVLSNTSYFNNDLITDYTTNTKGIVKNTRDLLVDLKGSQYLGNDSTSCRKKCDDPEIMQRIMEQYNNDNLTKGRFDQEINTMYTVFKSATDSADRCHIYFAQNEEFYADKYAINPKNSSNYIMESKPALRRITMKQLPGTCTFLPVAGQTYLDISASDLALQSDMNDSNFYTSARPNCTNLDCTNKTLFDQALRDYEFRSGSRVTRVMKAIKVSSDTCDYNILQDLRYRGTIYQDIESVLRVKYTYPIYNAASPACESFSYSVSRTYDGVNYKSDTFELQYAGNLEDTDPNASPILSYMMSSTGPIASAIQNIL